MTKTRYPNGDRAAYVTAVYEASVTKGVPAPADGELSDVAWFTREELSAVPLSRFTRALLTATGYLAASRRGGARPSTGNNEDNPG